MEIDKFFYSVDYKLWSYVLEGSFVPTNFVDNEVVNKPKNIWYVE